MEDRMDIILIYPEYPDTFWGFKHAQFHVQEGSLTDEGLADRCCHAGARLGEALG
jgi:hypothetical protein